MTRRLAWRQVVTSPTSPKNWRDGVHCCDGYTLLETPWQRVKPGDRLWVRENFSYDRLDVDKDGILPPWYWADGNPEDGDWTKPKPSIHMPRWASRLTLTVTATKIERLHDISEADAKAEGCGLYVAGHGWITEDELRVDPGYSNYLAPRLGFEDIWRQLHGDDAWAANPEVVAISFKTSAMNIDSMECAA